jgi:hypothetical protein
MTRIKLYILVLSFCLSGYGWLVYNSIQVHHEQTTINPCLFKQITGIPCPSCGVTRSILLIGKGNIPDSLSLNPLGIILLLMAVVFPVWIVFDLLSRKKGFYIFYRKSEILLRKKMVAIAAIAAIIVIWIRNIHHHL